jgi:hypothetical protein
MTTATESRVPCSTDTRLKLKDAKRGGETYDELFQKMLEQYDPQQADEARF